MKTLATSLFIVLLFSTTTVAVPLVTQPTDLNPGDQYRLVFTTNDNSTNATSTNIDDYNSYVQAHAATIPELASLGTTWKVIGSTETVAARDNTGTNYTIDPTGVPIYTLADTRMADTYTDLWDGTIDAVPVDTFGSVLVPDEEIWTGTTTSGTSDSSFPLGATSAVYGRPSFTSSAWIAAGADPSSLVHRFYAISDVLTAVPEPTSIGLVVVASGFLSGIGLRRRWTR